MTAFISAGHDLKSSGAFANSLKEGTLTIEFRDLVVGHYKRLYPTYKVVIDYDTETLGQYLRRIKTGSGSVIIEFHFDILPNNQSGTSVWIGRNADKLDKAFAKEVVEKTSEILKIRNRGVFSEEQSFHKRLGLMVKEGTVCLLEICALNNKEDMKKYMENKNILALEIAKIIKKYEDMV